VKRWLWRNLLALWLALVVVKYDMEGLALLGWRACE